MIIQTCAVRILTTESQQANICSFNLTIDLFYERNLLNLQI